ncbi:MAG: hypothetical protein QG596_1014 [Actinomycetota bacterium]|nr:hypothetical protein [Actinomycetota bacterium]
MKYGSPASSIEGCLLKKIFGVLAFIALLTVPVSAEAARLDPSFGQGGVTTFEPEGGRAASAQRLVESPGGKLLTEGWGAVTRFKSDGSPDLGFGSGGTVFLSDLPSWDKLGSTDSPSALAVTLESEPVLAGTAYYPSGNDNHTGQCAFLTRLTAYGDLDPSFAEEGRRKQCLHKPPKREDGRANGLAMRVIHGDGLKATVGLSPSSIDLTGRGEIVVGGTALRNWSDTGAFIAKFNSDGTLDRSFTGGPGSRSGERGIAEVRRSRYTSGNTSVVRSLRHGKVLAAGTIKGEQFVVRLLRNGRLDPSFGRKGYVVLRGILHPGESRNSEIIDIAFDRRGRIVAAGSLYANNPNSYVPFVLRLDRDGRLDRTFGNGGVSWPNLGRNFRSAAIAIQRNGRAVVVGEAKRRWRVPINNESGLGIFRLTANGILDPTFFDDGQFGDDRRRFGGGYGDLIIDRRGRIVAAGGRGPVRLIRILPGK